MSEQEKSGHSDTKESSLVVVEQGQSTGSSRQKPYRPTDLQDDQPELHHKRSKAPAVPSVVEELKSDSVPTVQEEKSARKIHEHASSEKHKHHVSKKSSTKNRGSSASPSENIETIPLKTIEVEPAREKISLPAQPIPADVTSVSGVAAGPTKHTGHAQEDDIVPEEIAELRTREATKRISEWKTDINIDPVKPKIRKYEELTGLKLDNESDDKNMKTDLNTNCVEPKINEQVGEKKIDNESDIKNMLTSTDELKKKAISWQDPEYLDKVHLQELSTKSQILNFEPEASIGPCFRPGMPCEGPSGITICLPKKSNNNFSEECKPVKSGISIRVSKKSLTSKSKCQIKSDITEEYNPDNEEKQLKESNEHYLSVLRGKLDTLCSRIRHVLNI